jgi:hypothetical protein
MMLFIRYCGLQNKYPLFVSFYDISLDLVVLLLGFLVKVY